MIEKDDIVINEDNKKERVLHAVNKVAMIKVEFNKAVDELINEVLK